MSEWSYVSIKGQGHILAHYLKESADKLMVQTPGLMILWRAPVA